MTHRIRPGDLHTSHIIIFFIYQNEWAEVARSDFGQAGVNKTNTPYVNGMWQKGKVRTEVDSNLCHTMQRHTKHTHRKKAPEKKENGKWKKDLGRHDIVCSHLQFNAVIRHKKEDDKPRYRSMDSDRTTQRTRERCHVDLLLWRSMRRKSHITNVMFTLSLQIHIFHRWWSRWMGKIFLCSLRQFIMPIYGDYYVRLTLCNHCIWLNPQKKKKTQAIWLLSAFFFFFWRTARGGVALQGITSG